MVLFLILFIVFYPSIPESQLFYHRLGLFGEEGLHLGEGDLEGDDA